MTEQSYVYNITGDNTAIDGEQILKDKYLK